MNFFSSTHARKKVPLQKDFVGKSSQGFAKNHDKYVGPASVPGPEAQLPSVGRGSHRGTHAAAVAKQYLFTSLFRSEARL